MRKFLLLTVAGLVAVAVTASIALAAVTVKQLPTISFDGDTATVSGGNFSGLGNQDAVGVLTVDGIANYTCKNKGGNASPGQNPVDAGTGSSGPQSIHADKNGRATVPNIDATLIAPQTPSATEVGCGGSGAAEGGKWTVTLDSLEVTSAHFEVRWPGETGSLVLCRDYTPDGSATGTDCL